MNIGTWNVRSLFWSGAIKVLHNELSKLGIDIVALQETRLESDISKFDNFALFYITQILIPTPPRFECISWLINVTDYMHS
jgi:exonuclease III